jgi:pantetheine-phosphate adenylyltransferase
MKASAESGPRKIYRIVAMGGTFDVLHNGHKKLLRQAFAVGGNVVIGVTSDDFARSLHKPHKVDSYPTRKKDLERLLKRWGMLARARIVPIHDKYGPTIEVSNIDAIVVSKRTIKTAYEINAKRRTKRLQIIPIDLLLAEDRRPISSTRIRRGKIDRRGRLVR